MQRETAGYVCGGRETIYQETGSIEGSEAANAERDILLGQAERGPRTDFHNVG